MNAPAIKRMTVREFLAWAEAREDARRELVRGEIVAMAPERAAHVRAKLLAVIALRAAIADGRFPCEAFAEGLAVMVDEETCDLRGGSVTRCTNCDRPVIIVEVLSPSTRGLDKTIKLADYFRIPSLRHYLIVDLTRRHVVRYSRQPDGVVTVAVARDGDLTLAPRDCRSRSPVSSGNTALGCPGGS
jgi:Uma2 family endonuclease